MLNVTPIYAGLIALLFLVLSYRVVQGRRLHGVSVGDGGREDMIKRIRVQANCAEYGPFGLILLAGLELQGVAGLWIHAGGAALLAGRVLHAWGLGSTPQVTPARYWGMVLTFASIAAMALGDIGVALRQAV